MLFTFVVTSMDPVAYASQGIGGRPELPVSPFKMLEIPAEFGQVTDMVVGDPSAPAFIHIQSAHGSYEAEKNIEKLLGHIEKNSSVRLMLLEGAANKLQPELFRIFPDHPDFNRKVTDKLMQEGYLTGPENFLINQGAYRVRSTEYGEKKEQNAVRVEAFGIEDLDAYKKDREAFISVVKKEKTAEKFLGSLRAAIDKRFAAKLNKELLNLVRQEEAFGSGTVSFEGWLKTLGEGSKKHLKQDLSDAFYQDQYPFLIRYFRLQVIGSKIDREKARIEAGAFLKELEKRGISKEIIKSFEYGVQSTEYGETKEKNAVRLPPSAIGEYSPMRHAFDRIFEKMPTLSMKQWPNWTLYAQHVILMQELEGKGLHEETVRLKDKIRNILAKTADEREYLSVARKLYLLRRLFSLELTRSEYEELVLSKAYGVRRTADGKGEKHDAVHRTPYSVQDFSVLRTPSTVQELYDSAMDFYSTAIVRENRMFTNALNRMRLQKQDRAVIVTGGFHADGLKKLAVSKGCSYLQITPRITEVTKHDHEVYLKSMFGARDVETSQITALLGATPLAERAVVTGDTQVQAWRSEIRGLITNEINSEDPAIRRDLSYAMARAPIFSATRAEVRQPKAAEQAQGDTFSLLRPDFRKTFIEMNKFNIEKYQLLGKKNRAEEDTYQRRLLEASDTVEREKLKSLADLSYQLFNLTAAFVDVFEQMIKLYQEAGEIAGAEPVEKLGKKDAEKINALARNIAKLSQTKLIYEYLESELLRQRRDIWNNNNKTGSAVVPAKGVLQGLSFKTMIKSMIVAALMGVSSVFANAEPNRPFVPASEPLFSSAEKVKDTRTISELIEQNSNLKGTAKDSVWMYAPSNHDFGIGYKHEGSEIVFMVAFINTETSEIVIIEIDRIPDTWSLQSVADISPDGTTLFWGVRDADGVYITYIMNTSGQFLELRDVMLRSLSFDKVKKAIATAAFQINGVLRRLEFDFHSFEIFSNTPEGGMITPSNPDFAIGAVLVPGHPDAASVVLFQISAGRVVYEFGQMPSSWSLQGSSDLYSSGEVAAAVFGVRDANGVNTIFIVNSFGAILPIPGFLASNPPGSFDGQEIVSIRIRQDNGFTKTVRLNLKTLQILSTFFDVPSGWKAAPSNPDGFAIGEMVVGSEKMLMALDRATGELIEIASIPSGSNYQSFSDISSDGATVIYGTGDVVYVQKLRNPSNRVTIGGNLQSPIYFSGQTAILVVTQNDGLTRTIAVNLNTMTITATILGDIRGDLMKQGLDYFKIGTGIDLLSHYPFDYLNADGSIRAPDTQLTLIGFRLQMLGNVLLGKGSNGMTQAKALVEIDTVMTNLRNDQATLGWRGLLPSRLDLGLTARTSDGLIGLGDNANLSQSIAVMIGALESAGLGEEGFSAIATAEAFLAAQGDGYAAFVDPANGLFHGVYDKTSGSFSSYHIDRLANEFRGAVAFLVVQYPSKVPRSVWDNLLAVTTSAYGDRNRQAIQNLATWDGGAFQMFWPLLRNDESRFTNLWNANYNYLATQLDYAFLNRIPGILSASSTPENSYYGNIGIPQIAERNMSTGAVGNTVIGNIGSTYALTAALSVDPAKILTWLAAIKEMSGMYGVYGLADSARSSSEMNNIYYGIDVASTVLGLTGNGPVCFKVYLKNRGLETAYDELYASKDQQLNISRTPTQLASPPESPDRSLSVFANQSSEGTVMGFPAASTAAYGIKFQFTTVGAGGHYWKFNGYNAQANQLVISYSTVSLPSNLRIELKKSGSIVYSNSTAIPGGNGINYRRIAIDLPNDAVLNGFDELVIMAEGTGVFNFAIHSIDFQHFSSVSSVHSLSDQKIEAKVKTLELSAKPWPGSYSSKKTENQLPKLTAQEIRIRSNPPWRRQNVRSEVRQGDAAPIPNDFMESDFDNQIIQSAQAGVIVLDRDLRYRVWNPFMEKLTGIKAEEAKGKHLLEIAPFLKAIEMNGRLRKTLKGEILPPVELPFELSNGKSGWVSVTSAVLHDPKGKIIGIIVTVQDIAERKKAEEAKDKALKDLRRRNRVESILSTTSRRFVNNADMANTIQKALQDIGRLSKMDRTYLVLIDENGTTMSVIGEWYKKGIAPLKDLYQNLPVSALPWLMKKLLENKPLVVDPARLPEEAVAERHMLESHGIKSLLAVPFFIGNDLIGFIGSNGDAAGTRWEEEDIRIVQVLANIIGSAIDRMRSQNQLMRQERLVAMGALMARITHELNNPIAIMEGLGELIWRALIRGDITEAKGRLKDFLKHLSYIRKIVKDMLLSTRPKEAAFTRTAFPISRAINAALKSYATVIRTGQVVVDAQRDDALIAYGDEEKMIQVFMNLIKNSLDVPKGSDNKRITIRVKGVLESGGRKMIRIQVRDNGAGAGSADKWFEPYYTTKPPGMGTRLGLSLVKTFVEEVGGTITVTTGVGKGATFEILIPHAKASEVEAAPAKVLPDAQAITAAKVRQIRKILVVDDQKDVRELVEIFLKGYVVISAQGGEEALELLSQPEHRKKPFDLIITDYRMVLMNGAEFAREFREMERKGLLRKEKTPVVLMTGLAGGPEYEVLLKLQEQGVLDQIEPKTMTSESLQVLIERMKHLPLTPVGEKIFEEKPGSLSGAQKGDTAIPGRVASAVTSKKAGARVIRILFADDYEDMVELQSELIKDVLKKTSGSQWKAEIDTAKSGEEALSAIEKKGIDYYDGIILDDNFGSPSRLSGQKIGQMLVEKKGYKGRLILWSGAPHEGIERWFASEINKSATQEEIRDKILAPLVALKERELGKDAGAKVPNGLAGEGAGKSRSETRTVSPSGDAVPAPNKDEDLVKVIRNVPDTSFAIANRAELRTAIEVTNRILAIFSSSAAYANEIAPKLFPEHSGMAFLVLNGVNVRAAQQVFGIQVPATENRHVLVVMPGVVEMGLLPALRAVYQSSAIFVLGADSVQERLIGQMNAKMSEWMLDAVEPVKNPRALQEAIAKRKARLGVSKMMVSGFSTTNDLSFVEALKKQVPDIIFVTNSTFGRFLPHANEFIQGLMTEFQAALHRARSA